MNSSKYPPPLFLNKLFWVVLLTIAFANNLLAQEDFALTGPIRWDPHYLPISNCAGINGGNGKFVSGTFKVTAIQKRMEAIYEDGGFWKAGHRDYYPHGNVNFELTCSNHVTYAGHWSWKGAFDHNCGLSYVEDCSESTNWEDVPLSDWDPSTNKILNSKLVIPEAEILQKVNGMHVELPPNQGGIGKLSRPIVFVPGLGQDFEFWKIEPLDTKHSSNDYKNGKVKSYLSGGAPDIIARMQHLDIESNEDLNGNGIDINSNGIYFFNPKNMKQVPNWTDEQGNAGQAQRLYDFLRDKLQLHYGDSWKTNSELQIDLVGHSQGGLVIRELFYHASETGDVGALNPVNHIRKFVSLDVPHFGSWLSNSPETIIPEFSSVKELKQDLLTQGENSKVLIEGTLTPDVLDQMWEGSKDAVSLGGHEVWASILGISTLGVSTVASSLVGSIYGANTDVSYTMTGGLLGPYKIDVKEDIPWPADDIHIEKIKDPSKEIRGKLDEMALGVDYLATTSLWITEMKHDGFPERPDGTKPKVLPLYSSDIRGLEQELLSMLGETYSEICDETEKTRTAGCFGISSLIQSGAESEAGMDMAISVSSGSIYPFMKKFRSQWLAHSDLLVQEKSQTFVDGDRINPKNTSLRGYFEEPRTYALHKSFAPYGPESIVPHGDLEFGERTDDQGNKSYQFVHRGVESMGIDIYCALDNNCSDFLGKQETPLRMSQNTITQTVDLPSGLSKTVASRTLQVKGDFSVSPINLSESFHGIRVQSNDISIATIAWIPDQGAYYSDLSGTKTWLANSQHPVSFAVKREGDKLEFSSKDLLGHEEKVRLASKFLKLPEDLEISVFNEPGQNEGVAPLIVGEASPTDPATQVASIPLKEGLKLWHRESREQENNYSLPRILLQNNSGQALNGFTMTYWFQIEPGKIPQLSVLNAPNQNAELVDLGEGSWKMVVHAPQVIVAPGDVFPDSDGDVFKLSYTDGSSWYLLDDWSENRNFGIPAQNKRIALYDLQGKLIWGTEPISGELKKLAEKHLPKMELRTGDASLESTNQIQPVVKIKNLSTRPIKNFHAYYYIRIPSTKVLASLEDWWTPNADVSLQSLGEGFYAIDFFFNKNLLNVGETVQSGSIGLHFSDWSLWGREDDPSAIPGATVQNMKVNQNAKLVDEYGRVLFGNSPVIHLGMQENENSNALQNLQVYLKDEAWGQENSLTPRLYVRNESTLPISGFQLGLYIETENGNEPVLDNPWWVPNCQVNKEQKSTSLYKIHYDCSNIGLSPGEVWPDETGSVLGMHYSDWSVWDKTNDPSMFGITGVFQQTDQISVSTPQGVFVKGIIP